MRLAFVIAGAALLALGCRGEKSDEARGEEVRTEDNAPVGSHERAPNAGRDDREFRGDVQEQAPAPATQGLGPDGNAADAGVQGAHTPDPRMMPGHPASEVNQGPGNPADQSGRGTQGQHGGTPTR